MRFCSPAPQHGRKSGNEKFGNRKFKAEGLTWDSEYEYYCWQVLGELQKQKLIFNLRRQVIIRFAHNGVHICRFIPDFGFDAQQLPKPDNNFKDRLPQIIADAKSKFVANFQKYKWQKNMLRAFYSREVLEFIKGETHIEAAVKNRGCKIPDNDVYTAICFSKPTRQPISRGSLGQKPVGSQDSSGFWFYSRSYLDFSLYTFKNFKYILD
jgi:hypothetical protein